MNEAIEYLKEIVRHEPQLEAVCLPEITRLAKKALRLLAEPEKPVCEHAGCKICGHIFFASDMKEGLCRDCYAVEKPAKPCDTCGGSGYKWHDTFGPDNKPDSEPCPKGCPPKAKAKDVAVDSFICEKCKKPFWPDHIRNLGLNVKRCLKCQDKPKEDVAEFVARFRATCEVAHRDCNISEKQIQNVLSNTGILGLRVRLLEGTSAAKMGLEAADIIESMA